eukprot:767701-Hanusia_phi.AAC.8
MVSSRRACKATMAAILWTCSRAIRSETSRRLCSPAGGACMDQARRGMRASRGGMADGSHPGSSLHKSDESERLLQSDLIEKIVKGKKAKFQGPKSILCKTCWLATKDCICSAAQSKFLWDRSFVHRIFFYMHAKEFARCSNTACLAQIPFPFPQCDIFIAELPEVRSSAVYWLLTRLCRMKSA